MKFKLLVILSLIGISAGCMSVGLLIWNQQETEKLFIKDQAGVQRMPTHIQLCFSLLDRTYWLCFSQLIARTVRFESDQRSRKRCDELDLFD